MRARVAAGRSLSGGTMTVTTAGARTKPHTGRFAASPVTAAITLSCAIRRSKIIGTRLRTSNERRRGMAEREALREFLRRWWRKLRDRDEQAHMRSEIEWHQRHRKDPL